MDCVAGQSAHGARDGEPDLATPFRPRYREHAEQFRPDGDAAIAPRAAGLARDGIRARGLERQEDTPPDLDVERVPDGLQLLPAGECPEGFRKRVPVALPSAAFGRGDHSGYHSLG